MKRFWPLALILLGCWPLFMQAQQSAGMAYVLEIDGPIGPATSDYLHRGMEQAREEQAKLIVLRTDTPGGLDSAMREIIQDILGSPIPVAVYVAPSGARAASAGTYILYASHVAAMAPATNLGAATPVQIGGAPTPGEPFGGEKPKQEDTPKEDGDEEEGEKESPAVTGDAMKHKIVNDAIAYIRGLAQMRGRNAEWAEKAVREAASLPAQEALEINVIDLIAKDIPDLLEQIDGRKVEVAGQEMTLETANLTVRTLEPDWRNRLLAVITNPNVAYILMLIGIYGLFFEFANPGFIVPGVAGAICLLLALYAFQVLPVDYAGVGLIILGIVFMLAEAFVPSFGALGIGGVIAFVIGSVILFETDTPGYELSIALVAAVAAVSAGFFVGVIGMALRARRGPVVSGQEEMLNSIGEALEDIEDRGNVRIRGEVWSARTRVPVRRGHKVRVTGMEGLTLIVEPQEKEAG